MRPNGNRPPGDPGRAALFPPKQPKRSVLLATTGGRTGMAGGHRGFHRDHGGADRAATGRVTGQARAATQTRASTFLVTGQRATPHPLIPAALFTEAALLTRAMLPAEAVMVHPLTLQALTFEAVTISKRTVLTNDRTFGTLTKGQRHTLSVRGGGPHGAEREEEGGDSEAVVQHGVSLSRLQASR